MNPGWLHSAHDILIFLVSYHKVLRADADTLINATTYQAHIMRFPVSLPPVITVGEDSRDIPPVNELTVARPIAERSRTFVFRHGAGPVRGVLQHTNPRSGEARLDKEIAPDRRMLCRRIYHLPVMLDTRSGIDRRQHCRRDKEIATHIVIEA